MIFFQALILSSEASMPSHSSGIWSIGKVLRSVSLENSFPQTVATERERFTPFSLAAAMTFNASGIRSSSWSDFPIFPPCALMNVYPIPPPMIRLSTLSRRFLITPSLELTFEPPIMAVNGCCAFFSTLLMAVTSFSMRNPSILWSASK